MAVIGAVCFDAESLALLATIVGTLWVSLVWVWKKMDEEKTARINLLEQQRAALVEQLVSRGLVDQAREAIDAPRRRKPNAE